MKKYSRILCLLVLIACTIAVAGCSKSGGGGSSSVDENFDNQQGALENFYELELYDAETKSSSFVNILFHVKDSEGEFYNGLTEEDFEILEDDAEISPTESATYIRSNNTIPYKLYTVLMIDVSASVATNLPLIKEAAKELIRLADGVEGERDGDTAHQNFKIYTFSSSLLSLNQGLEYTGQDGVTRVVNDENGFSHNTEYLLDIIDSIEIGSSTTNLFGAVIEGIDQWEDGFQDKVIIEGALVVISDGYDTENHPDMIDDVIAARGSKRIFTIGIGSELKTDILEEIGASGFTEIVETKALTEELTLEFSGIQDEVDLFARSFYWLSYLSPKRGDKDCALTVGVKDNTNNVPIVYQYFTITPGQISHTFKSTDFFSAEEGIYVNDLKTNPADEDYLSVSLKKQREDSSSKTKISLVEYVNESRPGHIPLDPDYSVSDISCQDGAGTDVDAITVINEASDDPSVFTIEGIEGADAMCLVTIDDINNVFSKTIKVDVSEYGVPRDSLIAYYDFDGNSNDSTVYANHGTAPAGASYVEGRSGDLADAILINSKNDFITIPEVNSDTITVSMWYHSFGTIGDHNTLLGGSGEKYRHLAIDVSNSQLGFSNDDWQSTDDTISWNVPWYHFVLIKDNVNSKIYINGVLVHESASNFLNSIHPLSVIGNTGFSPQSEGARGYIDDVRIYNRSLNEYEIEYLYSEE